MAINFNRDIFFVLEKTDDTDDGGALNSRDYVEHANSGLLIPKTGREKIANEKVELEFDFVLYCDYNIEVDEKNKIMSDGKLYEIVYVAKFNFGNAPHQEILLKLIR